MSIIENRKAFHDFLIEERFEAGLVLQGWEVKAIREGRAQLLAFLTAHSDLYRMRMGLPTAAECSSFAAGGTGAAACANASPPRPAAR